MGAKFGVLAVVAATACGLLVAPVAQAAKPTPLATISNTINTTASGTYLGVPVSGVPVSGQLTDMQFVSQNGDLVLTGVLNGTATVGGTTIPIVDQTVTMAVQAAQPNQTCEILDLTVAPIHLDLLGLIVDTNTIELRIVAESGPGNLLGNLLCSLAGLLDPDNNPGPLARELNTLLGL